MDIAHPEQANNRRKRLAIDRKFRINTTERIVHRLVNLSLDRDHQQAGSHVFAKASFAAMEVQIKSVQAMMPVISRLDLDRWRRQGQRPPCATVRTR
ncbi:Os04g0406101 [Oryza sativa Japonica Group]|uniref:Os04g0406101 protein n=1 Tax=Oryza sativa subsp. japonica TaxID=39947 RepID=A0A0P0W9X6_ORYSJ|nr:Os04g0406101 [Oryza sativa Japonica Group]